jgi:hypothetical protein
MDKKKLFAGQREPKVRTLVLMSLLHEHARSHPHVAGDERVFLDVSTPHMIHMKTLEICYGQDSSKQVPIYIYIYASIYWNNSSG